MHPRNLHLYFFSPTGGTQRVAGRLLFAAGLIGAAGSFAPGNTAKFVLLLAPLVLACGLSTVMSWRFYREESRK